ncbi:RNA polymerase sigma factor [Sphingobacterium sp. UBA1498]|uniref:RNA polymerase sigma factor n=1 Tax=Sphingobacterium sp. UBA1498 TaxID=1947481 RepID=UPI0025DC09EB|nr:sigma-70 family RNA polymerase sigma factor [Sphingobacterium sp. UBA1498]
MITQIDETGFKSIFYEYYDILYSGFYKKTQSDIVSQDLVQLTFIRFWKYRESFNPEIAIEIQLFRKGKQTYIDWLRKEARNRELMDNIRYQQTIPIEELSIDLRDSLLHAIDKLPEVRRKVFHLAYIEGYSHKEIASKLGISVRTVDTHIYKALKQLRKILAFIFILIHLQQFP